MGNLDPGYSFLKTLVQRSDGINLLIPFSGEKIDGAVIMQPSIDIIISSISLSLNPGKLAL